MATIEQLALGLDFGQRPESAVRQVHQHSAPRPQGRCRPPKRAPSRGLWGGVQLAVDTTLVSALDSLGRPRTHARSARGAALRIARRARERTYPELLHAPRCRLVVLALKVGG